MNINNYFREMKRIQVKFNEFMENEIDVKEHYQNYQRYNN